MDVLLMATTGALMAYLPRRILQAELESQGRSPALDKGNTSLNNLNSSKHAKHQHHQQRPVSGTGLIITTLSLGLSLTLFALRMIELVPGSWLWFFTTDQNTKDDEDDDASSLKRVVHRNNTTVADAYCVVLWSMAFLCTVIIPSTVGTRLCWLVASPSSDADANASTNHSVLVDPEDDKKRNFSVHVDRHCSLRLVGLGLSGLGQALSYLCAPCRQRLQLYCSQRDTLTLPLFSDRSGGQPTPCWALRLRVFRFCRDATYRRCVVVGSLAGTALTCLLLAAVSPFVIEPSMATTVVDELWSHPYLLLQRIISWLCSLGILLSTVLNGFGSISLPYSCLAGLFLDPVPRDCVANAELELVKANETLTEKRDAMASGFTIPAAQLGTARQKSSTLQRFLWKHESRTLNDIGDELSRRKRMLRTEIEFLEALIDEMSDDVEEMRDSQALSTEARSSAGRLRSWIGMVCSVLLLLRLAWAMSSVWNQYALGVTMYRSSQVDPVTQIVVWLSGHVRVSDLHTLSQFTSLVITACLSVSQVRTFFRTCDTVQRRVTSFYRKCYCKPRCRTSQWDDDNDLANGSGPDEVPTNSWFLSHVVSVLMCCYCLACIVLTKMMLPFEYRTSFSQALNAGSIDNDLFKIRTLVIDATFSLTAIVTGAVLAMILGIMRSNARRYRSSDTGISSPSKSPMSQAMAEP